MNEVYTREQWHRDGTFSAKEGQEVEEYIYWEMYDVLPPLRLPKESGYSAGFRVSEPYAHAQSQKTGEWLPCYAAFGKRDGKYYFIGYMNKYGEFYSQLKKLAFL